MSNELIFYTNPLSRGRIVRWLLEELGVPYEAQILEYGSTMKSPEYLAINPMGKVPAIKYKDTVVTELVAICLYLAEQFPHKNLAPALDSPHRGTYYRWMIFAASAFDPAMFCKKQDVAISDDNRTMSPFGEYEDVHSALREAVSQSDYICGGQFTAADVVMGSYINFYMNLMKLLEPCDEFEAYVARITNRPAWKRAQEIDGAV